MSQQGVLLVNLGSPDSTDIPDVRKYLNEFLMDGRVIDYPWLLRRFVVNMVLRKRPATSQSLGTYKTGAKPMTAEGTGAGTAAGPRSEAGFEFSRSRPSS